MRYIIIFFSLLVIGLPANAANWNAVDRVPFVGSIIAKKNSLGNCLQFKVVNTVPNNNNSISTNLIQINQSDLTNTKDDNEVAYIISNELGNIIAKNINPNKKHTEYDINAMSIDLMINSGYNPLASISILSKNCPNDTKKMHDLYDYISYNYPTKILIGYYSNEYENFLKANEQEFNNRKFYRTKRAKFNRTQSKLAKARTKRLNKYNEQVSKLSKWNISTDLLMALTEPEQK